MITITIQKNDHPVVFTSREMEMALAALKQYFVNALSKKINLMKVEAPLIVKNGSGVNDDLNGVEKPVSVYAKSLKENKIEIIHSLAKWKRAKLAQMKSSPGEGLFTDMRALRPDEEISDVHSIYVDQWDWEKVILESNRKIAYLKKEVTDIYACIKETEAFVCAGYPALKPFLPKDISFIHACDLAQKYPDLSPKERENKIALSHGAVFIIGIGGQLSDGKSHDGRAPDYDDWSTETEAGKKGLNGDIIVWNPVLKRALEISSMGIRVNKESLSKQLLLAECPERMQLDWHKKLLAGELPQTIGGGIGQSRLAMLLLQRKHIGEVQASVWPEEIPENLKINLL